MKTQYAWAVVEKKTGKIYVDWRFDLTFYITKITAKDEAEHYFGLTWNEEYEVKKVKIIY